jgi:ubiquitin-protein ligase
VSTFTMLISSDGQVCLSLLGTFDGPHSPEENWQPNKSTIMQVLISIQSSIFVEKPLFNIPGLREETHGHTQIRYNQSVRLDTFRYAICDWLVQANSTSIWKVPQINLDGGNNRM